jgi:hypothetical protein
VADEYALDVGDGIQRSRRPIEGDAEVARSWVGRWVSGIRGATTREASEHAHEHRESHCQSWHQYLQ